MKTIIQSLKKLTGHTSITELAKFLGHSRSTLFLAGSGQKTKLNKILPMLNWFFENTTKTQHEAFLKKFKTPNDDISVG